ncbi:peptidoglycan D,D-transpeptidase FtsI family protein [Pontivivens insulae]|uniref:Putative peptidoglycan D,D-transpeptidase FtsI n=1 Tax=Pontivivens insulae TaxID=1639689 RepID=A0A2R8AG29_9RHOB|nr:penicillin-binding protein 2 [Pontivivens insulae]RED12248.1 cell division protein FtsI (penicillin-binding protein 3) [Pontivivens insulae]SPF31005.1 putative peptidoglycan D,D-transpeptidase FtsI [Pontivivens insulae]
MIRVPLRPLARVIAARNQGIDPDVVDAERRAAACRLRRAEETRRAQRRLWLLSAVFVMGFGAVAGKMAVISASDVPQQEQSATADPLRAHRADIVDVNGELLATNIVTSALYVETRRMVDPEGVAIGLANIFPDLEAEALMTLFARPGNFHWIQSQVSPEQLQAVHDLGQPGVFYGPRETRVYPQGRRLGHILGGSRFEREAARAAETAGTAGVELMFNERLGDPERIDEPLRLSIDLRAQNAMRDVLAQQMERFDAIGATGILMRADNGEIVSMVSLPDFDPNDRPAPRGPDADQLFSRASQGVYELGSTFKTLTVAQSLELGLVNPETMIDTRGPLQWGRFRIRDFHNYGPELSVTEVMEHSSNIGTARIALDIGIERHQEFLRELGFFDPVEVELPESRSARPLLPPRWSDLSTMTISYGHGLAATPLHLASAYATVANGGLRVTPTLLADAAMPTEADRVISERTSGMVNRMLRAVVSDGTAGFADVEGYEVGGKTGTADKPSQGGYAEDRVIATFAAVFPASDPEYVLVVTLDEPEDRSGPVVRRTAGWTAAPTAGMIIRRVAPVLGLRPQSRQSDPEIPGMALAGGRG